jgi:hypothetical protein
MRLRTLFVGLAFVAGGACRGGDVDAPADAYRTYAAALRHGDATTAWGLLSNGTKQLLTAKARAIADARGVPPPADGKELAFADTLRLTRDIKTVSLESTNGERARLEVVDAEDGKQQIRTVHEDGQWRIDLTEELKSVR